MLGENGFILAGIPPQQFEKAEFEFAALASPEVDIEGAGLFQPGGQFLLVSRLCS